MPSRSPDTYRDRDTFLRRLAEEAQLAGTTEASIAAEACAKVIRSHIAEGEWDHVLAILPSTLAELLG